jgi:hypothetical protein
MDLLNKFNKYLVEAKYIPNMKYWPDEEIKDYKSAGEEFIQLAKISDHLPAHTRDVTASIGIYMKKNNKKKVKQLIDKYPNDIIGGTGTINQIINWIRS